MLLVTLREFLPKANCRVACLVICGRVKYVNGVNGGLPGLLVAEHKVDPLMNGRSDRSRFQRLSMNECEQSRVVVRHPAR